MRIINKLSKNVSFFFVFPSFLGVCIFVLVPFLKVIVQAFTQSITGQWTGLENFICLFRNKAFLLALKNTFLFSTISILALIICSVSIAIFLFNIILKKVYLVKIGLAIPLAIPSASVALFWELLFDNSGWINGLLHHLNMENINWLNSKRAFLVLVLTFVWKNLGLAVILWLAGLANVPQSIYEACKIDGAGFVQCYYRIIFPNLKQTFYIIIIYFMIQSFKSFREAYFVSGEYPHDSIYLLQHIFNNWFRDFEMERIAAGAVITMILVLIFILSIQQLQKE